LASTWATPTEVRAARPADWVFRRRSVEHAGCLRMACAAASLFTSMRGADGDSLLRAAPATPLTAVVAIARRGGIDILDNEVSKRNTAYVARPRLVC